VADAANAMGATYLTELFKHLPCELIMMNFNLDGTFPAHEADPFKEENNLALMKRVVEEKADLGIATDGDGDRIFFIDNEGKLIEPAMVRGLLAKVFLEQFPGSTICYDIRPGRITQDMIEQYGGKPSVTKVGHSLIKEQALREGAVFAGESSGHFFVKLPHGTFEAPCIVVLKLLQLFSRESATIADQVRPLRKYFHSGEINSTVTHPLQVMANIKNTYGPQAKKISELDGITIEYEDYWFNVRASNTEPLLRLNLEARSAQLLDEKTKELLTLIRA
jgi:phosphomannomutase